MTANFDEEPTRDSGGDVAVTAADEHGAWYAGITRYQWLVLVIASLGWVFDVFEGQIFVASMNEAMPSLVPPGTPQGTLAKYNDIALAAFLLGGALGGPRDSRSTKRR